MSKWKEFTQTDGGTVWINLDMISDFEMTEYGTDVRSMGDESYYELKDDVATVHAALIKREKEQK